MNVEALRDHVLNYENVSEGFPFGEDTLVFKIYVIRYSCWYHLLQHHCSSMLNVPLKKQ